MRTTLAILLATVLLWSVGHAQHPGSAPTEDKLVSLVVVVHPDNPTSDLDSKELLAYFKLDHQWWPKPDRKRTTLVLRGTGSDETRALLETVYKMTSSELRKYWTKKVFRGDIARKPVAVVKTKDVLARIARDTGAFSIVRAGEVTEDVSSLTIDGKRPGDEGYMLDVTLAEPPGPR